MIKIDKLKGCYLYTCKSKKEKSYDSKSKMTYNVKNGKVIFDLIIISV